MTREEADQLAKRIVNCWHTTIPRNEWADYLAGLEDAERAGRTFLQLREREAKSFREFGDVYRGLARAASPPTDTQPGEPDAARHPRITWEQAKEIMRANGAPDRLLERPSLTDAEVDRLTQALKETA